MGTFPKPHIHNWEISRNDGPVIATSVHSGNEVRPDLADRLALTREERFREEDPLTDVLAGVGDQTFRARTSRFEIDLNRPEHEAVYLEPSDAWGLDIWKEKPTDAMVRESLQARSEFYAMMKVWIEDSISRYGRIFLIDLHSFNHRRDGKNADPSPMDSNPDIDLGVTTADLDRFGSLADSFEAGLQGTAGGRQLDIRRNVRFIDGGHWPEWVYAEYGSDVCTITVEDKKIFMDEWTGLADIQILEDLRLGLARATHAVRRAL